MRILNSLKKSVILLVVSVLLYSCSAIVPINTTENPIGSKIGYAQGTTFMFLWLGHMDLSITKAAKQGGITKIATVDWKVNSILGILNTYTVIVTGE